MRRSDRPRSPSLFIASMGLLLLGAGSPTPGIAASSAPAPARSRIEALGRIEPGSEVVQLTAPAADRLDTLLVKRGDSVKKGQVLGYLASHQLAVTRRTAAQIQLKQAAELGPLRVAAQQANVAALQTQLDNSRDILSSNTALREKEFIARRTVDDQQALVRQQAAGLLAAQALLNQTVRQADLDRLSAEANLANAEAEVSLSTLYAPIDGQVLNILIQPGGQVNGVNGLPILALGDTAHMRTVAEIYETDVGLVRMGQTARVSSPALPAPLTGKVVEIGHMVFKNDILNVDPAARADARVVEVRIELDDSAPVQALTNLTVDVAIDLNSGPRGEAKARP